MNVIITNLRRNEERILPLCEKNTLEEAADYLVKRIYATYPKAYKVVINSQNHIRVVDGKNSRPIFDVKVVEELRDYDDVFLS